MKRGFYTILAAQFFSSLADNALLIASIGLLSILHMPDWLTPLLKTSFTVSYVVLACFVGVFADSRPKGHVMLITNTIKILGCVLLIGYSILPTNDPTVLAWYILTAYAVVGIGAAAYSPAKYGILTELLPAEKLVVANGWMEGLTVLSIIAGTVIGGQLVSGTVSEWLLSFNIPYFDNSAKMAMLVIILFYIAAAIINTFIPDTGIRYQQQKQTIGSLIKGFIENNRALWKDKLGQISLAVTTLLWGVGATLQFIVLEWAKVALDLDLDGSTQLVGIVAIGIAAGSVVAAKFVSLKQSTKILPFGIAIGLTVATICLVDSIALAVPVLILIGGFAGFFIVPMNALLQHRGYVLMSAGSSIAVQNFNENIGILLMTGFYAFLIKMELSIFSVILILCSLISLVMLLITLWYRRHAKQEDLTKYIGEETPVHQK